MPLIFRLLSNIFFATSQALIASAFAKFEYKKVKEIAYHALKVTISLLIYSIEH